MPVYSKSGRHYSHDFKYQNIKKLDEIDYANEVIFYHHPYDKLQQGITFYNCLDEKNWQYFKDNPNVRLIHQNDSETFEIHFVNDLIRTIRDRNLNTSQIDIIVMDDNHKTFLERHLALNYIQGPNITVQNYLFNTVEPQHDVNSPSYKFSSLSRNYRIWRLFVYAELVKRNLLENFNYSFHNINPYGETINHVSFDTMILDLTKLNFGEIPKSVRKWLKRAPYELTASNEVRNKWSNVTYDAIKSANFHLIIETHFDQKEFFPDGKGYDRDFSPTSITEKGYKPIACKTPFIVFSTPNYLNDLRALGFKTFSPYINETYDLETDSSKRLTMIVDEIQRICNLPPNEYQQLVTNCLAIAKENFQILIDKQNAQRNL